jgi:protein required for attachment to host cells
LDDHREQHQAEGYRRFARRIADATERFATEHEAQRLLLLAPPRLLGVLRPALDPKRLAVTEIGEDLSGQPLKQIHEVLAARGLVPAMQAPRGAVFRPRGQPPRQ